MSQPRESKADRLARDKANRLESIGAHLPPAPAGQVAAPAIVTGIFGTTEQARGLKRSKDTASIEVGRIAPDPDQPRKFFDPEALARMAESLKAHGQVEPIGVYWDGPAVLYRIAWGERRWRGAGLAGLESLVCVVLPKRPDNLRDLQLIENIVREDLSPLERAKAFKERIDRTGCSVRQLAQDLAVSHATVIRSLALLGLPEEAQAAVESGQISPAVAEEIRQLDPDDRVAATHAAKAGASRREIRDRKKPAPKPVGGTPRTTHAATGGGITPIAGPSSGTPRTTQEGPPPPLDKGTYGPGELQVRRPVGPNGEQGTPAFQPRPGVKLIDLLGGGTREYRPGGGVRVLVVLEQDADCDHYEALLRATRWAERHREGIPFDGGADA